LCPPSSSSESAENVAKRAADGMSAASGERMAAFDPKAFKLFRFVDRQLDRAGHVRLRYALDEEIEFVEEFDLPVEDSIESPHLDGLLSRLHWVAGVSYFKTAVPGRISCETGDPPPAAAELLEALYSEGLGEFAYANRLPGLPKPVFPRAATGSRASVVDPDAAPRVLVPVGGGKDSAVAIEIVRRSGVDMALFSVGDAPPILRTAAVAGVPHLVARRRVDPSLVGLNRAGALNGHVPITAIVTCAALLTASLNGFDAVAMANERSASSGNVMWAGTTINHQFSKSAQAESLLRAAVAELAPGLEVFSVLRPASELAIARAFARMEPYHEAFTSCNAIFRLDPEQRASSWCGNCPKCRFVFLVLAPFSEPAHLREIFGRDLLDDCEQLEGFAVLTATGGHKPFECVGEEQESLAAIRMLARDSRWRDHCVVRRLAAEVLPLHAEEAERVDELMALSDDHAVPELLMPEVRAVLGS
jgi:UDP-N-acetyl-alpha-D-muramoyl-L-alanyl-L-glutamate epimerase